MPDGVRSVLESMLSADPTKRPTAMEVYAAYAAKTVEEVEKSEAKTISEPSEVTTASDSVTSEPVATDTPAIAASTTSGNPFYCPGDL